MDLEKILSSNSNFRVIRFFYENPQCLDTYKNISVWTGLKLDAVKKALKNLCRHNIVVEHKNSSVPGYSFTNDTRIVAKIKSWFKQNTAQKNSRFKNS
ncbi:MAG: hypothetical protein KKA52_02020 [Candidatus Omnitrophica bacterium]|nr:hypothetical protein [Candidatus Omnitrophota bacterium]